MTFDMYTWGDPSRDAVDHWLDEALRAVPLPDGFLARVSQLAERTPEHSDGRPEHSDSRPVRSDGSDDAGRRGAARAATRGLADVSRRLEASGRRIRPS